MAGKTSQGFEKIPCDLRRFPAAGNSRESPRISANHRKALLGHNPDKKREARTARLPG